MSIESDLRAALLAHAPLLTLVPAGRISIDAVAQGLDRPYIAFSKQSQQHDLGLSGSLLATAATIDVQCIGTSRTQAIQVADAVRTALVLAGQPSESGGAGYDPDNDIEAEIVTVNWISV